MNETKIARNEGTVKFFNGTKGFGFIKDNNSTKEYFVHVTGCVDTINENDVVEFDLKEGPKGLNAINVKLVQYLKFFNKCRRSNKIDFGQVPKWLTGPDCKSGGLCLRGFESLSAHPIKLVVYNKGAQFFQLFIWSPNYAVVEQLVARLIVDQVLNRLGGSNPSGGTNG